MNTIAEHTAPCPPGRSGYQRHGCRCPVCTAGNREYQRDFRRRQGRQHDRAYAQARSWAAAWVREHQPHLWARLWEDGRRAGKEPSAHARSRAATLFRERHPESWQQLLDHCKRRAGLT